MKKQIISNRNKQLFFTGIAAFVFLFAATSSVAAQGKFKPGDRVECDDAESGRSWRKGTVIPFKSGDRFNGYDSDSGYFFRYMPDGFEATEPEGRFCKAAFMRLQAVAANNNANQNNQPTGNQTQITGNRTNQTSINNQNLKYKPGDRVECDKAGIDSWEKGTVMPFLKNDRIDGETYRVRLDSFARSGTYLDGIFCQTKRIRPLGGAAWKPEKTAVPVGEVTTDENNTLSADRPILDCPAKQSKATNGSRPNAELIKKIIRCNKGERAAAKGYDGAVTVDVTALEIGTPRKWIYMRDIGGKPGTIIYPVKATFHYKTFYRDRTEVSQNWIRILNFYVNEFGEWKTGSEESVKAGEIVNVPRDQ